VLAQSSKTARIGSALREMREKKTNRAYKHSFPAWLQRIDLSAARRRLSRRSEEFRSDGFRQIYSSRAPTATQSDA